MAEQLPPFPVPKREQNTPAFNLETAGARKNNVTFHNFNPEENTRHALKKIGEVTMLMAVKYANYDGTESEFIAGYGEILSSEPMMMEENIEEGTVDVMFIQYWKNYRGDTMGTPHSGYKRSAEDNRSLETIRILSMHYDPVPTETEDFVVGTYLPPRIHKHKLLDYQALLRTEPGRNKIAELRERLWGSSE